MPRTPPPISFSDGAITPPGQPALEQALTIMGPLVTWLLRSGVDYTEFVSMLKPVFLAAAQAEIARIGGRQTDSAISLLSGLHRKDVRVLAPAMEDRYARTRPDVRARLGKPSLANEVATRWLTGDWADELAFSGSETSFEALARSVSRDTHPRAVLQELIRLGVAEETPEGLARLRRQAFVPDARHEEARQLLAGSVGDHLAAGVHNLSAGDSRKFLEQSVFADGLSAQSVRELEQLANRLWQSTLEAVVKAAVPLCEKDEPNGGDQRLRLGMFCYAAPMAPAPAAANGRANHDDEGKS